MEDVLSKTRLSNIEHTYLHRVHDLVRKMAKKLAARHSQKRREYRRGQLNMPRTMRAGIANDGLMFDVHWRRTRKEKPQILAVCDVSGFGRSLRQVFTAVSLQPAGRSAPSAQLRFFQQPGEVSELFEQYPVEKAIELVNWKYGGATDYGHCPDGFCQPGTG